MEEAAAIYTELRDEGGRVTAARVRDAVRSHLSGDDNDTETVSADTKPTTPADADPRRRRQGRTQSTARRVVRARPGDR